MVQKKSSVDAASILHQAVLNTSTSLEIFREAVSNSVDAAATEINILLTHQNGDIWDITIEDDGHGMKEDHMDAFFRAGTSVKDHTSSSALAVKKTLSIGEKGLGSKTTWVAEKITVESIRNDTLELITGVMKKPLSQLEKGIIPKWDYEKNPSGYTPKLIQHGTHLFLEKVRISTFNSKKCGDDIGEIADRLTHYLRAYCATGTTKNLHASQAHVKAQVFNVGVIPDFTVEVRWSGKTPEIRGPISGCYDMPSQNTAPKTGPMSEGVMQKSQNFCDTLTANCHKTIVLGSTTKTVNYDVTCIVAGNLVKDKLIQYEKTSGVGQKSLMGFHYCKDFIPLKTDLKTSKQFLPAGTSSEYFYDFKVFLNCQNFTLNADRNGITNLDADDVSWILEDFIANVWPNLESKFQVMKGMRDSEEAQIVAAKKSAAATKMLSDYSSAIDLTTKKKGVTINYCKQPTKEADVTHILAAMFQSGDYKTEFDPLDKFGQFADGTTDAIFVDNKGNAQLIEVEYRLDNLYKHKHPMDTFDGVIVWTLDGAKSGHSKDVPWGAGRNMIALTLTGSKKKWYLKWGTHKKRLWVIDEFI